MKYTTAILALATAASAQDLSIFPECSLKCIQDAVPQASSCDVDDYACVCDNIDAIQAKATVCVVEACGSDVAIGEVLPAVQKFCSEVGSGSGSDSSSSSSAPADDKTTSTTVTVINSSTTSAPAEEPTDGGDDEEEPTPSGGSAVVTPAPTATGGSGDDDSNPPAETSTSVSTAGAVAAAKVGSFGLMLLGAVAAL